MTCPVSPRRTAPRATPRQRGRVVDAGLAVGDPDSTQLAGALCASRPSRAPATSSALPTSPASPAASNAAPACSPTAAPRRSPTTRRHCARSPTRARATTLPTGNLHRLVPGDDSADCPHARQQDDRLHGDKQHCADVTASAGITSVTEGGSGASIDPSLAVADSDDANLASRDRGHQRRAFGRRHARVHGPERHHRQLRRALPACSASPHQQRQQLPVGAALGAVPQRRPGADRRGGGRSSSP